MLFRFAHPEDGGDEGRPLVVTELRNGLKPHNLRTGLPLQGTSCAPGQCPLQHIHPELMVLLIPSSNPISQESRSRNGWSQTTT